MKKIFWLTFLLVPMGSASVFARDSCYILNEREVDLCMSQQTDGYVRVELKTRKSGKVVVASDLFSKISDTPSLLERRLSLAVRMSPFISQEAYTSFEKFLYYKLSPIRFVGRYDYGARKEVGKVTIGSEAFTYEKPLNVKVKNVMVSQR